MPPLPLFLISSKVNVEVNVKCLGRALLLGLWRPLFISNPMLGFKRKELPMQRSLSFSPATLSPGRIRKPYEC